MVRSEWTGVKFMVFMLSRAIFARETELDARMRIGGAEGGLEIHGPYLADYQIWKSIPSLERNAHRNA